MARVGLQDFYQNFQFHLFDITVNSGRNLFNTSSLGQYIKQGSKLFALSPSLGFQSITPPSVTVETKEIAMGNSPYSIAFPKSAEVENMTLSRGVRVGDQEFFDWINQAIQGHGVYRRNLMLVQFHTMPGGAQQDNSWQRFLSMMGHIATVLTAEQIEKSAKGSAGSEVAQSAVSGAQAAAQGQSGAIPKRSRIWRLHKCMPVSYTAAESLDASDSDISIAEIELDVEYFEEYSFGVPTNVSQQFDQVQGL